MKKKIILTFFIIICSGCVLFCSFLCYKNMIAVKTESDISGKDINKEEYIYKEDLLHLGYSMNDIQIIENKISNFDVKNYLLTTKYKNLTSFISSPYFDITKVDRYQKYFDRTSYTADFCVLYVEIGLDRDFYTNINMTDVSKNELMIVNKYNSLSEDFVPNELVELNKTYGKGSLEKVAYDAFVQMCDDALKDGIKLHSVSAYRSYKTQKSLYNSYLKKNSQEKTDTFSARAGHSEHQTGYAVDINTSSSKANFDFTPEYEWLIHNSYKYGFILRYPKNKTHITGYKYEPWHFRYVGVDAAFKIYEENITFEEYFIKYL